jgi:phospholipid/cholesterol/gamma-HCH transport system substrate-binding protein
VSRKPYVIAIAFVAATALVGALIVGTLQAGPGGDRSFVATLTDASGLEKGEDVRVAGVSVGKVQDVEVAPDNTVRVTFGVSDSVSLTSGSQVAVRYKNLIGDHFLSLSQGPGGAQPLAEGAVIPVANTRPALDLDELYNGFAPLFEGLNPDEINQVSTSLVEVLQGQGGSIQDLLRSVGSFTGTLADRDRAIGDVVTNLNTVLGTLDTNSQQVGDLVGKLQTLVSGLAADRQRLGTSLEGIESLTGSLTDLLHDGRPDIAGTVRQVDRLASVVNADGQQVEQDLANFPGYYQVLGRIGSYQSGFQFYLCGVQLRLKSPTGEVVETPMISSEVARCQF